MRRPIDDPVLPTPRRLCQQEPASEVLESTRIEAGGRNPDVTYTGRPAAPLLDRVPSIRPAQTCMHGIRRNETLAQLSRRRIDKNSARPSAPKLPPQSPHIRACRCARGFACSPCCVAARMKISVGDLAMDKTDLISLFKYIFI